MKLGRKVTLLHRFGGQKDGLDAALDTTQPPKTAKVLVQWDLHGVLEFSAMTGLEHRNPRGQWRLSDEDVQAFCWALKVRPIRRKLAPLKERTPKQKKADPRQLSLVSK